MSILLPRVGELIPDPVAPTTLLSDLLPMVMPYVPGAAEIVCEAAIRRAARELCQRALVWTRTPPQITTAAGGQTDYTPALNNSEAIHKLLAVHINGEPIRLVRPEDLDETIEVTEGLAVARILNTTTITLAPKQAEGARFVCRVALQPNQAATTIDTEILERYGEHIAYGAIAHVAAQPERTYSNPSLAEAYRGMFEGCITKARVAKFHAHSRVSPRVRPRFF